MTFPPVQLGEFNFDPKSGELSRGGIVTRLRPQASRTLECLSRRPGQLVTRDELSTWIWPDGRIDADLGLNVCIRQVRAALGDDADNPKYVETLRARGYRLVADVTELPRVEAHSEHRRRPLWVVGALAVAGLAVTAVLMTADNDTPAATTRLAVMPFEGIAGPDSVDYLRVGLAEDVITTLAKNDPALLAVVARTSAFGLAQEGLDPIAAADELGVNYLLQGSLRSTQDGYRLTARLLDVEGATYLWSELYDLSRGGLLEVDKDISRSVLAALRFSAEQPQSALAPSPSPLRGEARDAVLRARFLISKRSRAGANKALEFLAAATGPDSAHAAVLVEIARAQLLLGHFDTAERAIGRARETEPLTPGLDLVAGRVALYGRRDVAAATEALSRAAELEPGAAEVRHTFAQALAAAGRLSEAVTQGELALALDPVSSAVRGDIGWVFYYAGNYPQARRHCRATLDLVPESTGARVCTLLAAHFQDDLASEEEILGDVLTSLGASAADAKELNSAAGRGDSESLWRWLLDKTIQGNDLDGINVARLQALLGRSSDAASTLQKAVDEGQLALWVGVDPVFAGLRGRADFEWSQPGAAPR